MREQWWCTRDLPHHRTLKPVSVSLPTIADPLANSVADQVRGRSSHPQQQLLLKTKEITPMSEQWLGWIHSSLAWLRVHRQLKLIGFELMLPSFFNRSLVGACRRRDHLFRLMQAMHSRGSHLRALFLLLLWEFWATSTLHLAARDSPMTSSLLITDLSTADTLPRGQSLS